MQTIHGEKIQNIGLSAFNGIVSPAAVMANQAKKLKIREYISWSACFGVIFILTGLLKFLKVGVAMDMVTSAFFYLSILGLSCFVYKIISFPKSYVEKETADFHNLN